MTREEMIEIDFVPDGGIVTLDMDVVERYLKKYKPVYTDRGVMMTKQEEIRERMQCLWCQHCKALQKTNDTVVECWYNPLDQDSPAFCEANHDAIDAILGDQHSQGVVIQVPLVTLHPIEPEDVDANRGENTKLMESVGYESLIEE